MAAKTGEIQHQAQTALVQYAAIVWRRLETGEPDVLLVSSRDTGRWVIPKGWPMKGKKPHEAAAKEALEEAGIIGRAQAKSYGTFTYFKRRDSHFDIVNVDVFLMEFRRQAKQWREAGQRKHLWLSPAEAALLVEEPGLALLFQKFASSTV